MSGEVLKKLDCGWTVHEADFSNDGEKVVARGDSDCKVCTPVVFDYEAMM